MATPHRNCKQGLTDRSIRVAWGLLCLLILLTASTTRAAQGFTQASAEIVSPSTLRSIYVSSEQTEVTVLLTANLEERLKTLRLTAQSWLNSPNELSSRKLKLIKYEIESENPDVILSTTDLAEFIAHY